MQRSAQPPKTSRRRALMAASGGRLALVPFEPQGLPPDGANMPASLGAYLAVERVRERLRVAAARLSEQRIPAEQEFPIRIG